MSFQVVGIGEVLWDLLPDGPQMGGAPANFAYHAGALGAEARVVSRVGRDEAGSELIRRLERLGVRTDAIEVDPDAPTGTVAVEVATDGQPRYVIHENVAWDRLSDEGDGRRAVATADAVCFGTLAQRSESSRRAVRALLKSAPAESLRIFDVNVRQHFFSRDVIEESLRLANVLKVNEPELALLTEMFRLPGDDRGQVAELARCFRLRLVAYTRGSRGGLLHGEGQWSEHPGVPTTVADTVGAGDSFSAALALGLLAGWPLDEVNLRATEVAAYVCSQRGGMPALPNRLRAPFVATR
ncbi:MAG TPA: carbohydrate kinase [Gemmataceae bacterium]|nr:carbohydrate kinase [Gemmataceae bacterium]